MNGICLAVVQRSTRCARRAAFCGLMQRQNWNFAEAWWVASWDACYTASVAEETPKEHG